MAERGNTKHGSELDDQMKHEAEGIVRGTKPAHVEEGRETEPFPDETDPQEVQNALNPGAGKGEAGGGLDD
ncbi:hypothetical protein ACPFL9_00380 [Paenarthrobacter sp. NyZ202]|uniref:hypothetical protein n=1 Tax=Paenarthrobacter sp. NyZ202 TaxID=3402689 RepID=UPI003CEDDBE5